MSLYGEECLFDIFIMDILRPSIKIQKRTSEFSDVSLLTDLNRGLQEFYFWW